MRSDGKFSRRQFMAATVGVIGLQAESVSGNANRSPDVSAICRRIAAADQWRTENLTGYSVKRRYTFSHGESANSAEMLVKLDYTYPGHKNFEVISVKNPGFLEDRVFHRAMNAEIEAARDGTRDSTRILPRNYFFETMGSEAVNGRPAYVMRVRPRGRHSFRVDGKIWVDRDDAAVVRIEGDVDANSFWVRSFHMVQDYRRVGPYWLVACNKNDATVRILGEARLTIESFDYQLRSPTVSG
jgi:hypothetical protein